MGVLQTYEDFVRVHEVLLLASGLPKTLWRGLFEKLSADRFDAGEVFEIEEIDGGRQRRLMVRRGGGDGGEGKGNGLEKEGDVFLVDHAWSFRLPAARQQLEEIPGLAERMAAMMCVAEPPPVALSGAPGDTSAAGVPAGVGNGGGSGGGGAADDGQGEEIGGNEDAETGGKILETALEEARARGGPLESLELDEAVHLDDRQLAELRLPESCPELARLSLWGTRVRSLEGVLALVRGLPRLRAIWLNETPLHEASSTQVQQQLVQEFPNLELVNAQVSPNYGLWAIAFCADVPVDSEADLEAPLGAVTALDLTDRCMPSLKAEVFNSRVLPALTELDIRGNDLAQQPAEKALEVLAGLPSLSSLQVDVPGPLGCSASDIFEALPRLESLNGRTRVEHAAVDADSVLTAEQQLARRLPACTAEEPLVERVLSAMWQYLMMYRLATEEQLDETAVWYVMDEVGSALRHSDAPSVRVAPFLFMPAGTMDSAISYTLMWPVRQLLPGQEATRDYLPGVTEAQQRSSRLTAWFYTDTAPFLLAYKERCERFAALEASVPPLPPKPSAAAAPPGAAAAGAPRGVPGGSQALRVYSDIPQVHEFLRRPEFVFVEEVKDADIVWVSTQLDDATCRAVGVRDDQMVNQFPFEACIVMKHHLADTVQRAYGNRAWLQPTYNMETEFPALIGDMLTREATGGDAMWIAKPWNMARSLDATVVSSLPPLVRLLETGPKIAQKYIEKPALFKGRKFDLRFFILLHRLRPLAAYVSHVFWSRLAAKEYTTEASSLSDFETHFTVMNYVGKMNHILTHEFVARFEKEHNVEWAAVEARIRAMLREVLEAAARTQPGMHRENARAIYGADIMLDADFNPKLLEVTYCPDTTRGCKFDMLECTGPERGRHWLRGSEFYNNIFGNLFLGETTNMSPL